jgi:hypothetical protein
MAFFQVWIQIAGKPMFPGNRNLILPRRLPKAVGGASLSNVPAGRNWDSSNGLWAIRHFNPREYFRVD